MELLVVVLIIAITAMLAGPAWRAAAEERRTSEAALDLVRVFRRMRSESMAYGRAHILRYTTADSGTFEVYRGTASECNSNLWAPLVAEGPCGDTVAFPNSYCVDGFSMADEAYSIGGTTIQVTAVASKGEQPASTPRPTSASSPWVG